MRRLARRIETAYDSEPPRAPLVRVVERPHRIPLSYAQQRIWFLNRFEPESAAYTIPLAVRLRGPLDGSALRDSVVDVLARHEILRTVFPADAGEPFQRILDVDDARAALRWETDTLTADSLTADDLPLLLGEPGFDITTEIPLRVRLLAVGGDGTTGDDHLLVVLVHHIAADGESMRPLLSDLWTAYLARAEGRPPAFTELPVQFADHALWQRQTLGDVGAPDSVLGKQVGYWVNRLSGLPDLLPLPTDRPRPPVASQRNGRVTAEIPTDLAARISASSRQRGITDFMTIHAALAILLARLSASRDIAISTPVAGRGHAHLDDLVGMFVNTLVLRSEVDPAIDVRDFLDRVRIDDVNALARADVPFDYLVDRLSPARSEAFAPLSQVMLSVLHGSGTAETAGGADEPGELRLEPIAVSTGTTQLDMTVAVSVDPGGSWPVEIVYATDLFDASTIEVMITRLIRVLDALADPEIDGQPVGEIDLADDAERARIDELVSGPDLSVPWSTVSEAVDAAARREPDAVALVAGDRTLTYAEFTTRVSDLAQRLADHGVGPDVAVGVCIPRSVELVLAIHAVVAAGGGYVVIDPATPVERLAAMIEAASISVILTADPRPEVLVGVASDLLVVDAATPIADGHVAAVSRTAFRRAVNPDNALYTLFTSGSTGTPKGVTVSHRAVLNRLAWMHVREPLGADDVVMLKTPATFDVSVPELFAPLMAGARLVIAEDGRHIDPAYVLDEVRRQRITSIHFVPSMMAAFAEYVGDDPERRAALATLRRVHASGEALPAATAHAMGALVPDADIDNLYGPTEAAVEVTAYRLGTDEVTVPIGRPIANTTTWVLDDRLQPAPIGVVGELYVGGGQLARGYASRPDLTAERFVADPTGRRGARLYRTGDLVRWNAAGELEYLGRADFQVKLRGQRIELAEIESILAQVDGITHAAATVRSEPSGEVLVGYLAGDVDLDAVRARVAETLPQYMRPTQWVILDEVPLTSTGKLDRRALPAPTAVSDEFVPPADGIERALAAVFADVLALDEVSVTVPFFDLGGHSLAAMRVVAGVAERLGVDIDIRDVFSAPTVRELARTLTQRRLSAQPLNRRRRPERIPLSFAQQRIWFINQFDVASPVYNMPVAFDVLGDPDPAAMRAALLDAIARHEPLRSVYPMTADGTPVQLVLDPSDAATRLRWDETTDPDAVMAVCAEGFDVTVDLSVRAAMSPIDGGYRVVVVIHHIAGDAASLQILTEELLVAYQMRRAETDLPAPEPLPVGYADHTLWQRETLGDLDDPTSLMAAQYDYWSTVLDGVPAALDLPTDRPRPPVIDHRGGRLPIELGPERSVAVARTARASGLTPFMVCHAAFAAALARLADVDDVSVGAAVSGRGQAATARMIGMFINTVVLRTKIGADDTVADLLELVRETDASAFAHADIPFETLVERLAPVRSTAHAPLVQVMINYLADASAGQVDQPPAPSEIANGLRVQPVDHGPPPAKVDLTLGLVETTTPDGIVITGEIDYAAALFEPQTVSVFRDVFHRIIDAITADEPTTTVLGEIELVTENDRRRLGAVDAPGAAVVDTAGRALPPRIPGELRTDDPSTGVLARWLDGDGEPRIEVLGRLDRQVRVGGLRVDLDLVETTLAELGGVRASGVVAVQNGDDVEIHGWVSVDSEGITTDDLRRAAVEVIAPHCVPSVLTIVDEVPVGDDGRPDHARMSTMIGETAHDAHVADQPVAPAGKWEVLVAECMTEVTGVAVTSAVQGFFDVGGTSLSAVRLVAELRRRTGISVEVAWVFAGPTPRDLGARLAAHLQSEAAGADTSDPTNGGVVVPLRREGSRNPVFCVHPADGLAWLFAGLAPHLDDRPVYGIQDPYVVAGDLPDATVHDLAVRYVDEIRRIAPAGPYHLLGWSIGGLIAQEMAVELRLRGEDVGFLGLLDSYPADDVEPATSWTDEGEMSMDIDARELASELLGGWREVVGVDELVDPDDPGSVAPEAIAAAVRDKVTGLGLLDAESFDRMLKRMTSSAERTISHRPRPYDGDTMLIVAADSVTEESADAGPRRWAPYLGGGITRIDIDTDHLGIVGSDALSEFGPRIDAALSDLESRRR